MTSPLSFQPSALVPKQRSSTSQQQSLQPQALGRPLSTRPSPGSLSVNSVLVPPSISTNNDLSNPPSASSATTSFRIDWPSDGPPTSASSTHRRADDIEMDAIIAPTGHRRRRSTLSANLNAASISPNPRAGTPRPSSSRNAGDSEPKISEEDQALYSSEFNGRDDDSLTDEDLHDDEETGLNSKDKRRLRKKRRRNTRLDQRIVREKLTDEERKQANKSIAKKLAINIALIALWYIFSLSISLYNKWMFDSGQLNFPFPLFTTSMHMLVQLGLSSAVLYFIPAARLGGASHHADQGRSRHEFEPERQPTMTKLFYFTRIGPCGAATGLDIGLGNTSLKFITLTFYTMCKSSALAFVLLFAFLFGLETPTWRLVAIIGIMTVGVIMMVAGEVEFHLGGFFLIISSAFFSGFRWGLTQILLLRHPLTSNPITSIFFLSPVMFITLFFIALPSEGLLNFWEGVKMLSNEWGVFKTPLLLLFPGTIAFFMTASEFALLQRSSVVTLSIAGIFKEVVTIVVAALVFDDKLTPINISGLLVTLVAIGAYNYIKFIRLRAEAERDAHKQAHPSSSSTERCSDSEEEEVEEEGAGLLAHREGMESSVGRGEGGDNHITIDGDLLPKDNNPRAQDDGLGGGRTD
ncbi:triose-phosphate transporter family-domain-containing protein [Xylariaceae sp. FL0594]|nr:triose-phosphate transporter family-domain-containing protein [Xylariaceae sp. FL0594]